MITATPAPAPIPAFAATESPPESSDDEGDSALSASLVAAPAAVDEVEVEDFEAEDAEDATVSAPTVPVAEPVTVDKVEDAVEVIEAGLDSDVTASAVSSALDTPVVVVVELGTAAGAVVVTGACVVAAGSTGAAVEVAVAEVRNAVQLCVARSSAAEIWYCFLASSYPHALDMQSLMPSLRPGCARHMHFSSPETQDSAAGLAKTLSRQPFGHASTSPAVCAVATPKNRVTTTAAEKIISAIELVGRHWNSGWILVPNLRQVRLQSNSLSSRRVMGDPRKDRRRQRDERVVKWVSQNSGRSVDLMESKAKKIEVNEYSGRRGGWGKSQSNNAAHGQVSNRSR